MDLVVVLLPDDEPPEPIAAAVLNVLYGTRYASPLEQRDGGATIDTEDA